ncbi:MAG: SurA N-terminal domain-containing protein [Pseudomonadota bacterium]|nr:SurA N-terminal domain-containing protein [Pseudomonadota bacterium]
MIQFMRAKASGMVAKILFIFLIGSFAIWGIGDIFRRGGGQEAIAKVGNVKITQSYLHQEFMDEVQRMRRQYGSDFDADKARKLGMMNATLQGVINRVLLDNEARNLGISVSDEVIRTRILEDPIFKGEDGRFDRLRFRQILRYFGLTEQGFLDRTRYEIAHRLILDAQTTAITVPENLAEEMTRFSTEERLAEVIAIEVDAITDPKAPDIETLKAYHQKHEGKYIAPEYRDISFAMLLIADHLDAVAVTDADLDEHYAFHQPEYKLPETRDIDQALVRDKATAEAVRDAVAEGMTLVKAAKVHGGDAVDLMPLEEATRSDLPENLAEAVFAAGVGAAIDPVQTDLGWHVAVVTDIRPESEKSLDEVKDVLEAEIRHEKAGNVVFDLSNDLTDAAMSGMSLEEAASSMSLPVQTIPAIDDMKRNRDGAVIDGIPLIDKITAAAFNMAPGTAGEVNDTDDGDYFLLRVNRIILPAPLPFEDVIDRVRADWEKSERAKMVMEIADTLKKALEGGQDPVEAAKAHGLIVTKTNGIRRDGTSKGEMPLSFVSKLFAAKEPGTVLTARNGNDRYVARLTDIRANFPTADSDDLTIIKTRLEQALSADIEAQFMEALQKRQPVRINKVLLSRMEK